MSEATGRRARHAAPRADVAVVEQAWLAADSAARAAGIWLREAGSVADCAAVRRVFDTVWSADPANPAASVELLRAFTHTGQYVVLVDDLRDDRRPVVAASMGFLAAPPGQALHSNVTGVLPPGRARAVGFALKLHQRAWALERGLSEVTWTFDPLVRRNAWFNLGKLGARVREYLVDFYGAMADGLNAGDASDRLYVAWQLADLNVVASAAGGAPLAVDAAAERAAGALDVLVTEPASRAPALSWPPPDRADVVLAGTPADVESLRRQYPKVARQWRGALRLVLGEALAEGWSVRGFARDGCYVLDRPVAGAGPQELTP